MTINILAFGIAKEILGSSKVNITFNGQPTVEALIHTLSEQYPAMKRLTSFMIAINGEYATTGVINPGDEVAIIPPVSGG